MPGYAECVNVPLRTLDLANGASVEHVPNENCVQESENRLNGVPEEGITANHDAVDLVTSQEKTYGHNVLLERRVPLENALVDWLVLHCGENGCLSDAYPFS